ncbi:MAG: glutaredoxin family protein [Steroidobacteraceae bacterium]
MAGSPGDPPTAAPGAEAGPVLYVRDGCHLCDDFLIALELDLGPAAAGVPVLDVDRDPDLAMRYGSRVPVLASGGAVICEGRYDRARVLAALQV